MPHPKERQNGDHQANSIDAISHDTDIEHVCLELNQPRPLLTSNNHNGTPDGKSKKAYLSRTLRVEVHCRLDVLTQLIHRIGARPPPDIPRRGIRIRRSLTSHEHARTSRPHHNIDERHDIVPIPLIHAHAIRALHAAPQIAAHGAQVEEEGDDGHHEHHVCRPQDRIHGVQVVGLPGDGLGSVVQEGEVRVQHYAQHDDGQGEVEGAQGGAEAPDAAFHALGWDG
jgi:hypothetical protein